MSRENRELIFDFSTSTEDLQDALDEIIERDVETGKLMKSGLFRTGPRDDNEELAESLQELGKALQALALNLKSNQEDREQSS